MEVQEEARHTQERLEEEDPDVRNMAEAVEELQAVLEREVAEGSEFATEEGMAPPRMTTKRSTPWIDGACPLEVVAASHSPASWAAETLSVVLLVVS